MYTPDVLSQLDSKLAIAIPVLFLLLVYAVPFFSDRYGLIGYPGPLLAKFSKLWFAKLVLDGKNIITVHKLHEKYGTFVRITPNQVSISAPEAVQVVYGHSSGALKAEMYDGFIVIGKSTSMFSTRFRDVHARKRKQASHVMSMKGMQELEPNILHHQKLLVKRWDSLCSAGADNRDGTIGSCVWEARDGRVWFNSMPWFNYEAFDIIGDLAFGSPFGMLESARDTAPVALSQKQAMQSYYSEEKTHIEYTTIPAVKAINDGTAFNTILGCLPAHWRPLFCKIPSFRASLNLRTSLGTMAVTALAKRLQSPSDDSRMDILTQLIAARDENGRPLPAEELSAEALAIMVAGSDTTANSLGAITYHLSRAPLVQAKLQKELDGALGPPSLYSTEDDDVPAYEQVKNLPYLQDVINEGLRIHSTIGIGLPRVVPETGLTIAGKTFAPGTEVSCPAYTIHRVKSVWGEDADVFDPDRWSRGNRNEMMKYFIPFSIGPRACIGRNLAMVELSVCIATIFHRYHFVLKDPSRELEIHDGFLRKPEAVYVGMKRRA